MKALLKTSVGLGIGDAAKPRIQSPYDVHIDIAMIGICRTDIYAAKGLIPTKENPLILGHEMAGIVRDVGDAVEHVRPGDRVSVMPVFPNKDQDPNSRYKYADGKMLGVDYDGAFCEEIVLPADVVYKLPDNVSLKQGAYLEPIAASLAVLNADLDPAQKGLIYGDSRIAQLTKRIMQVEGYNNIDTYDPEKNQEGLEPNAYDYIIETRINEESFKEILAAVKPGGKIVFKSRQYHPVPVNVNALVRKDVQIRSVFYGDFEHGLQLVSQARLNVDDILGDIYPLEEYEQAFALSEGKESKKIFLSAAAPHVWNL